MKKKWKIFKKEDFEIAPNTIMKEAKSEGYNFIYITDGPHNTTKIGLDLCEWDYKNNCIKRF